MARPRTISEPGIYQMTAAENHADVCPEPSLSAGLSKTLIDDSPRHAQNEHARLNPDRQDDEAQVLDIGTAAHALLLEGDTGVVVIEASDYRTKLAREARDAAR